MIRLTTGQAARTLRHPYTLHPPVLALDFGATSVLITTAGPVTVDDLKFARQLAREAAHFVLTLERHFSVSHCEHRHADQSAKATTGKAA
ncbi:hypothetical protein [Nonomuraea dietziae]|uniref:hypothetical protein n=1 Tax=Nonomuraea dietziae TaxID=65515 RepID=UPI003407503F